MPEYVWHAGSTRTCWGSLSLSRNEGPTSKRGGGMEKMWREGKGGNRAYSCIMAIFAGFDRFEYTLLANLTLLFLVFFAFGSSDIAVYVQQHHRLNITELSMFDMALLVKAPLFLIFRFCATILPFYILLIMYTACVAACYDCQNLSFYFTLSSIIYLYSS